MDTYLLIKVFHLVFIVAWFAGLFYIFRLFVYHVREKFEPKIHETLSLMERKLLYYITIPASVIVLLTGISLSLSNSSVWTSTWFHVKLTTLVFLFAYQELSRRTYIRFRRKDFFLTEKQCRFINEIPTLVLIIVVFLAVMKPFQK